jgi:hypothetical protein
MTDTIGVADAILRSAASGFRDANTYQGSDT